MTLVKAWALEGMDGEIHTVSFTREPLDEYVNTNPLAGLCKVIEIDYNDEPETEVGLEYREKIQELFSPYNPSGKQLLNFHFDKRPGFYAMSIDDRMKFVYEMLTIDPANCEEISDVDLEKY